MSQESFSEIEVDAPHFNNIIRHLKYKFYSLTEKNIPGFLNKNVNRNNIQLEDFLEKYSHCCQWIEETKNHSTRIFFFSEGNAENIKNNLLRGKYTKDALPLIQNNYEDEGGKVFNNIAVCGDIARSNNWEIDRVIRGQRAALNDDNYNDGRGFVYHVTNVEADHKGDSSSLTESFPKDNNGREWNELKSNERLNKPGYEYTYHPEINLAVCFVTTTLFKDGSYEESSYRDSLPTITNYNVKGGDNYYKRIKFPFEDISKRIVTNIKGQLQEEFSKIFYLCSACSQNNNYPSDNVTQVNYICGYNTVEFRKCLENVSQIKIFSKENAIFKIRTEKVKVLNDSDIEVDYIIAIPPEMVKKIEYLSMEEG